MAMGPSWVARPWKMGRAANMERRQCLSSLILSSSRSPDSARPRGRSGHRGHVTDGELVEDGVGEAGAVSLGEADEDDLDGEDGRRRGSRALGGEGSDGAGNLSATAVQSSGVQRVPAVNQGMPVPFSAAQAPVTPSIAQRPWMTSRSAFFSNPKGMMGTRRHRGRCRTRGRCRP